MMMFYLILTLDGAIVTEMEKNLAVVFKNCSFINNNGLHARNFLFGDFLKHNSGLIVHVNGCIFKDTYSNTSTTDILQLNDTHFTKPPLITINEKSSKDGGTIFIFDSLF